jgi:hypothetical protein
MKKLMWSVTLVGLAVILFASNLAAQDHQVRRSDDPLEVRVWTNKADGKSFGQGEAIIIYFRANRDCYVTIYDLDSRGDVNLLFPYEYDDPAYVEGGRVYTIPDYYDDYKLVVDGPPGDEYIQAVASLEPFEVPAWPSKFFEYDEYYPLHADRDAVDFLNYVNYRYFPLERCGDRCATDLTHFEVRRNWEYDWDDYNRPVYVYRYYDYDPWDWCGTFYIGYPYGAEIWIDGIFYGYAPCFVPRVVVGWHHFGVWYGGSWWWDRRVQVHAGVWYDYDYDDVRYKDSREHYNFKPKRRGSPDEVSGSFYPDRRKTVYTEKAGYVSKEAYRESYAKKTRMTDESPYFKSARVDKRGGSIIGSGGKGTGVGGETGVRKKTGKSDGWNDYNAPSTKDDQSGTGYKKKSGGSDEVRINDSGEKRSSGAHKKKNTESKQQPVFIPDSGSKKGGSSDGDGATKKSGGYSEPKKSSGSSSGPSISKGSGSRPSSGSGEQKSSGGGGKKGERR